MNKLRHKIFFTIFTILSLCLITILCIFTFQEYKRAYSGIERNLSRLNGEPKIKDNARDLNSDNDLGYKKFMDATLYTVILNGSDIMTIVSHTPDGTINASIEKQATEIIISNTTSTKHIKNLYFEKYAYIYSKGNFITIMDISEIRSLLISSLNISIFVFILLEIIFGLIALQLSKWIIGPVVTSFNKQKQFIADASHELKTPLSVIMASAETMEHTKNKKKFINTIKNEAERMSKLVKQLLDLARLDNDDTKKQYSICDLSKIIEKEILTLESVIYEKNIALKYQINKDIKFKCDAEEMKQLITILMDNAIKHSDENGELIVKLSKSLDNITLKVKNKGKPIPKGEEEKIFERFYRLDKSRNRDSDSYGLGLAIAKTIVTNHGGVIKASSSSGLTTFTIIFNSKKSIK